jgi:signal peptidase I
MSEFNNNDELKIDDSPAPDTAKSKPNPLVKGIIEQLDIFVIALSVIILATFFLVRVCTVSGDSMKDTLQHKDPLIVSDLFYTPKRGDIVVFHQTGSGDNDYNEPIVKRVIGVAGDTVKIEHLHDNMLVTITDADGNITLLEEDYIRYDYPSYPNSETYVEEGTVFVMGDNRSHSGDSRSGKIGLVDTRRILGKAVFQLGSNVGKPE